MPLSPSTNRELIHTRDIHCEGYWRFDGLLDVEGVLRDVKTYSLEHPLRNRVEVGGATHDMKVHITIGCDRVIRGIEVAMDAFAYDACPGAAPNYQGLVGVDIGPGFTKQLHRIVGGTHGCTHVTWLIQSIVRVALQTLMRHVPPGDATALNAVFGNRNRSDGPALLNSCRAHSVHGDVVRILYPEHYQNDSDTP